VARFKPWLKMWVEWIDDLKMLDLTLAEQGAWWRLCSLAQKCAADGALVKDNGAPLSLDEIASALRIKTKANRKVFDAMIQKMTDQDSLHWNSNTLVITHFAERQARTASGAPEAVRDRVRRFRERKAEVTSNPLHIAKERESTKEKDIKKDIEAEAEVECNALQRTVTSVTPKAILAEISQLYERNFGILTPILAEKFKDFAENYRGPLVWIKDAFAEAATNNVRKWAYVEKILETWQAEGRKPYGKRDQQGKEERGQNGTHPRDNSQSGRFGGFRAIESGPDEPSGGDED